MAFYPIKVGEVGGWHMHRGGAAHNWTTWITTFTLNGTSSIPTTISQWRAIRTRSPLHPPHFVVIKRLNTCRPFKIQVLNAQSLKNKAAAIIDSITSNHLQVMAIVQSWHESMELVSIATAMTTDEVKRLLGKAPTKYCILDLVPTWLLKRVAMLYHRWSHACETHRSNNALYRPRRRW